MVRAYFYAQKATSFFDSTLSNILEALRRHRIRCRKTNIFPGKHISERGYAPVYENHVLNGFGERDMNRM